MSLAQLVQLYAPLAGMLLMAAWLGALSQKVIDLKKEVDNLRNGDVAVMAIDRRLTRIETLMEGHAGETNSIKRAIEGIQRQLGNLMMKGAAVIELPHDKGGA